MKKLYVSPNGNDNNNGGIDSPFRTLTAARDAARLTDDDINIYLRGGVYCQDDTFVLDERDSNTSYIAYGDEEPIISGGKRLTGWEKVNDNIWRTAVDITAVRELYIDGKKANRAASKNLITPCGWYNDLSNLGTTVDGMFVKASEVGLWENAEEMQLHYARGWKSLTVNIDKIIPYDNERNIILSSHSSFGGARGALHPILQDTPFILENAYELMDTEYDFYYNSKEKYLYVFYTGDLNKAEVYMPVLEELLRISGSNLKNKAQRIAFEGITFTHATWYRPGRHGLIIGQAHGINGIDGRSHEVLDNNFIPANIRVSAAERITFKKNKFTGLGAVAVGFYEGVNKSRIEENVFYDICDSALTVGLPHHNFEDEPLCGYNHAHGKKAYASEEYGGNVAKNVNGGNLRVGWFTDMPDQWWEVDLGKNTSFDRIEIVSRLDQDQWDSRYGFSVVAAREETPEEYDVLFTAGDKEAFDFRSVLAICFDEHKEYRYIRVKRDIQHYFYLNEVRVIDTDIEYVPFTEVCRDNTVINNAVTRSGLYNYAAPAIAAYYTEGLNVIHNTIWNVPYSGISIGWGWSMYPNSVTCRRNSVMYNEVFDHLNKCFDGGAVYTLGNQPGSAIKGNYFHDQPNFPGVIYMDEGTEGYTITENVVENGDVPFFIHLPTSKYVKAYNNFVTSPSYSNQGEKCEVKDNELFIPGRYPKKAAEIINNAGVTDKGILDKIPPAENVMDEADKYTNVINEKNAVTDAVFITQYFKKAVYELESIINIARNDRDFSCELINELTDIYNDAVDFLNKPFENRRAVIDFKLSMKKRIKSCIDKAN